MRKTIAALAFVVPMICGGAGTAMALSLTAAETLHEFNLVTFGDATMNSHVDGRAYIGGNLTGGTFVQHPSDTPASTYAGLTVRGNATRAMVNNDGAVIGGNLSNSTINSGSSVVFGKASNTNFNGPAYVASSGGGNNFNGGQNPALATSPAATAATSTDFKSLLTSLSQKLKGLVSTGSTVNVTGNKATFHAVAGANHVAVFDLTSIDTAVFKLSEFSFVVDSDVKTIILNSDDAKVGISANFLGGAAQAIGSRTLWNFYNATDVDLYSQFGGSVLAPDAELTNFNNIEGGVFVDALHQNGEIHLQPFTGDIPDSTPVPEPGTLLLVGVGLAGVAAAARRRKA